MTTRSAKDLEHGYTAALAELRRLVSARQSGDARLDQALRIICEALGSPLAKILELEPTRNRLRVRAGLGWRVGVVGDATVPASQSSSAGYALAHEHAVIFDDIQRTRRFTDATLLRSHNVMSSLAVRMTGKNGVVGVLSVHEQHARRFTSREAGFLEAAAVLVAELAWGTLAAS